MLILKSYKSCLRILIICAISGLIGIAVNAVRPDGIPLIRRPVKDQRNFIAAGQKNTAQALFITLEDARRDYNKALMLDARPIEDFKNLHIKGARSLYYDDAKSQWKNTLAKVDKDREIITYCSDPECESAIKLADTLISVGFTKVSIMLDGIPAWKEAGYPVESGE